MKDIILGLGVALAIVLGLLGINPDVQAVVDARVKEVASSFGALAAPVIPSFIEVQGYLVHGNGVKTVAQVAATHTLTFAEMSDAQVITFTASSTQGAFTVTLPATSTFPLPLNPGATRSWVIENPFLAAATTTTIAAGTGIDLQEPDGQNVIIGINNYAFVTCFRELSSDIVCSIDETIPAD